MDKPAKLSLRELRDGMRVFLKFPSVETRIMKEVRNRMASILMHGVSNGGRPQEEVLCDYLDGEEKLKILLAFAGASLEKFKRVFENYYGRALSPQIWEDRAVRREISKLLISPSDSKMAADMPFFVQALFRLPENWVSLLGDSSAITKVLAEKVLTGMYSKLTGDALESEIRRNVRAEARSEKGQVACVDNKEVDVVVPGIAAPRILIMSSYRLTTSSEQSSRANEQARMYDDLQTHNRRARGKRDKVLMVNVIDGGGWLSRKNDLEKIWVNSDYAFSCSQMAQLREMVAWATG